MVMALPCALQDEGHDRPLSLGQRHGISLSTAAGIDHRIFASGLLSCMRAPQTLVERHFASTHGCPGHRTQH